MSQLADIAKTLNTLADEEWTAPDDMLKTLAESSDEFEKTIEEIKAIKNRILADERECADVVAAAQRLKDETEARAAAFQASLVDVEARCRGVEGEHDAVIAANLAEAEALRKQKTTGAESL